MKSQQARELFSARVDGELDDERQREFETHLQQDPQLQQDFERFAQVVHLLNVLPRPPLDPDFTTKVARRLHRRQRDRRRQRRERPASAHMTTIVTLAALLLVAVVGILSQPIGDIVAPGRAGLTPGRDGRLHLIAAVDLDGPRLDALLLEAQRQGLLEDVTAAGDSAVAVAALHERQLATFLDWLSGQTAIRVGRTEAHLHHFGSSTLRLAIALDS